MQVAKPQMAPEIERRTSALTTSQFNKLSENFMLPITVAKAVQFSKQFSELNSEQVHTSLSQLRHKATFSQARWAVFCSEFRLLLHKK